jgi:hypothetical protein
MTMKEPSRAVQEVKLLHSWFHVDNFNRTVMNIHSGQAFIENYCFLHFRAALPPLIYKETTTFLSFVYAGRHANR